VVELNVVLPDGAIPPWRAALILMPMSAGPPDYLRNGEFSVWIA
jgi:hypothetical protein